MSNIFEFTNKLRLVEIHRGYGLENITGHLWLATKDFALVSQLQDFDIDGVAILPMHQQLDFDFNYPLKKMHQWALKDKLSVNLSNFVNKLKFNDFNELLKQICQNKWFVSLEPELQIKSSAPWLWIGPIQKITKKCIFIEAVGVQPKPIGTVRIRIEDTTIIEIKKKYTKVYESYMNKNNASNL